MLANFLRSMFGMHNDLPKQTSKLSKSYITLIVSLRNLDYSIMDKRSGKILDYDITELDMDRHILKINDDDFSYSSLYHKY